MNTAGVADVVSLVRGAPRGSGACKVGYGDFHFIDWQPAEVTQTCLMSQEDRLTKCKTFLDALGAGVNTLFTPSGMLLIERRAKSASGTASRLPATFAAGVRAPGTPPLHRLTGPGVENRISCPFEWKSSLSTKGLANK